MDVVGHDHEGVQLIVFENLGVVQKSIDNHVGQSWLARVAGTRPRLVQQSIHGGKRLS
jgi:hypothetical protein